jgi:hypothetical protein
VTGRALSRHETHDLGMIIKDRAKVLKAHVEHQAAIVMADFEKKLAASYSFDQDEVWKSAWAEAEKVARECQARIVERCEQMGIPRSFAPGLGLSWHGRGENGVRDRQVELRRVAKSSVEEMSKHAILKIERQSLDLRTQVVALGLLSDEAKLFLDSLAPVEEAMAMLEFAEIEKRLEIKRADRKRLGYEP